jgi:V/A-type H+-transporting ATPase subunit I
MRGGNDVAIEKMHMVNLVGTFADFDKITKLIALEGIMQPVSALQEINSSDFVLKTSSDNIEALMEVNFIRPYQRTRDCSISLKYIERLLESQKSLGLYKFDIKDIIFDFDIMEEKLSQMYKDFNLMREELEGLKEKEHQLKNTYEALHFLIDISTPIEDMTAMKNFNLGLYKVSHENMFKLKANYENIPSVIQNVYKEKDFCIFIAFTPILLNTEADRIFKSANCEEIPLPSHYNGAPKEVLQLIFSELTETHLSLEKVSKKLKDFFINNSSLIRTLENSYELHEKAEEIRKTSACTNEFFYLSGWVPQSFIDKLHNIIRSFEDRIVIILKKPDEIVNKAIAPPTLLKNSKLFSPFQSMVGMYGLPSYNEIDPTKFLAVTYTLMFGAMFGDVGQGTILFLAGIFMDYKMRRVNLGGIFQRLGISSIIFGFLYGSLFGFEDVIKAFLIRPMEDINDVLIGAIVFGCGFLIVGFLLGITNSLRKKDIERGLFGKEGIAGFLFYIGVLTFAASIIYDINILPMGIWLVILAFFLLLILLKQPLANIIKGKTVLFDEGAKDYFIESSFEVIETILSMFSNTLSFIRVGAFALNHVGLFVAFSAMADMTNNEGASIFILILGNVIIICLEGLIVFIQGLRLQYYELFSKYYEGGGVPFEPVRVKFNRY